jgi:hypothetical protein
MTENVERPTRLRKATARQALNAQRRMLHARSARRVACEVHRIAAGTAAATEEIVSGPPQGKSIVRSFP